MSISSSLLSLISFSLSLSRVRPCFFNALISRKALPHSLNGFFVIFWFVSWSMYFVISLIIFGSRPLYVSLSCSNFFMSMSIAPVLKCSMSESIVSKSGLSLKLSHWILLRFFCSSSCILVAIWAICASICSRAASFSSALRFSLRLIALRLKSASICSCLSWR